MPPLKPGHLALVVAALAALALARQRVSMELASPDTLALDLLGVALFVWMARLAGSGVGPVQPKPPEGGPVSPFSLRPGNLLESYPGRVGLLLLSTLSHLAALKVKGGAPNSPDYWLGFLYWLLGVLFLLLACWPARPPSPSRQNAAAWLKSHRFDLAALVLLTAFGFFLRSFGRELLPYPLSGDEASVGSSGLAILAGRTTNMFDTGWSGQPNLSFLLPGLLQWAFGADIAGLRLFPALAGTLAIPALYLLALEMWGRRVALVASIFLATYHYHIHFSRIAVNNIADATVITAAFYLLWRGRRTGLTLDFALAGVVAGLGVYSYAGGRFLIALLAIMVTYLAIRERGFWRRHALGLLALAAGFLAATLPMLVYFAAHPEAFMARANQVGIVQSGWLAHEIQLPGKSLILVLTEQFYRSFFGFVHVPARMGFYNSPEPLLGFSAAILFLIGLGWAIWRWREPAHFLLLLWFSSIVGGTALFVEPPNAERMVATIPAVALMVALGLILVVHLARLALSAPDRAARVATAAAVLLLAAGSLRFYFLEYTPRNYFYDANSEVGMELGYYLRSLGPQYHAYFFGRPRMFVGFPSIPYLSGGVPGTDGPEKLAADLSFVKPDKAAVFVFIPERAKEMEQLQARFPEGRLVAVPSRVRNENLFLAWEVPPGSQQGAVALGR